MQGIFIDLPEEVAWQRNTAREHVVPEDVFKLRVEALKLFPPGIVDGFDSIFTLNENQEMVSLEVRRERGEIARRQFGKVR